jgi:hypothetical protein
MAEHEEGDFQEHPEKIAVNAALWMSNFPAFIAKDDMGDIVGVLLIDKCSHWWQDVEGLYNAFFYIKPEFRSAKLFESFLDAAENYAIINNTEFVFSLVGVERLDVKEKLLERYGYKKTGVFLQKDTQSHGQSI